MNQGKYLIKSNKPLTPNVFEMVLVGDTASITHSGQFINVKLDGYFLRRPISICDYDDKTITIIYKVVGHGTELMSKLVSGDSLDCLVGLGNGYNEEKCGTKPLLLGGGVGVPPLYHLAKTLRKKGLDVDVILGFNTMDEIFYESEFKSLGCNVRVTTVDGSYGIKGFVTDAVKTGNSYFYTCGPLPMLKAIYNRVDIDGEFSFEERMGCGFGACMGCSIKTKVGFKRVCKDGPVFQKEDILWEK